MSHPEDQRIVPEVSASAVDRPWVITAEGDVPPDAAIHVFVRYLLSPGRYFDSVLTNPNALPLPKPPHWPSLSFSFQLGATGIASPILEAIVFEGDRQRLSFPAQVIARLAAEDSPWMLVADDGKPYLVLRPPRHFTRVRRSEATRPYTLTLYAHQPDDSRVQLEFMATERDRTEWSQLVDGPGAVALKSNTFVSYSWGLKMHASSDGHHTPVFKGFAIDGDHRKLFVTAADAFGDDIPGNFMLIRISDEESFISLAPIIPKFVGFPSALHRLAALHQEGFFKLPFAKDVQDENH